MSKVIWLRNVPDKLHRKFKTRAAEQELSLQDYLLSVCKKIAEQRITIDGREQPEYYERGSLKPSRRANSKKSRG